MPMKWPSAAVLISMMIVMLAGVKLAEDNSCGYGREANEMLACDVRDGCGQNTAITAKSILDGVQVKSVLAATDFSSTSERSMRHALAIARYYGAKPYMLHVTLPTKPSHLPP